MIFKKPKLRNRQSNYTTDRVHSFELVSGCDDPLCSSGTATDIRYGYLISSMLPNFAIDGIMENANGGLQDVHVELTNDKKICDLNHTRGLLCLLECAEHV